MNTNRRKSGSKKSGQEVNGNTQSGSNYKVKNLRQKRRDHYKSEDQNQDRLAEVDESYLQFHRQRMYPAVSEPAVCGYPVSMACPYDPVPIYWNTMYQPSQYHHRVPCKDTCHYPRRHRLKNADNQGTVDNSKDTCQTADVYTSLPPVNLQDIESDHQRRFSDPGLANNSGSEEEEDSLSNDRTSSESWIEDNSQLASQIESLVQENKRISKELKETQTELQELKLEFTSISHMRSSCEPGFIADLVREVREATKLKEETLLEKFNAFCESVKNNQTAPASSVKPRKECDKECEKTKGLLTNITLEKEELSKRLAKLEEQMKVILAHNSIRDSTKDKLVESEKENLHLQQKLKTAVEAKGVAESNSNKYERFFSSMTKRLPNGLVLEEKGASLETSESLSSDLSSGSPMHSPQVTMSGPVTDL